MPYSYNLAIALFLLFSFKVDASESEAPQQTQSQSQNKTKAETEIAPEGEPKPEFETDSASYKDSEPIHPLLALPLAPLAILAPGSSHYMRGDEATSDAIYNYGSSSFLIFLASGLILGASGAADQTVPFIPIAMGSAAGWLAFASMDVIGSTLDKSKGAQFPSPYDRYGTVALEHIRVKSSVFENTPYSGLSIQYQEGGQKFKLRGVSSEKGGIKRYSFDYGRLIFARQQKNQGFYAHFEVVHEMNPVGFFRMTTLEPSLGLSTDATMFAPGLERIFFDARLGLQQHLLQYDYGGGGSHETDSSMMGTFETSWSATSWLKPAFGYRHERDSLVASQTTGFTGVFYGSSEFVLAEDYFLKVRSYLSGQGALDVKLFTVF